MAITVKQFRWYGSGDDRNYPPDINKANLKSGSIFFRRNPGIITMLGIQGSPGTTFYLNNTEQPTIIGSVGNYQLDLNGIGEITSIRFSGETLDAIEAAKLENGVYGSTEHLIVDAIYESGEQVWQEHFIIIPQLTPRQ